MSGSDCAASSTCRASPVSPSLVTDCYRIISFESKKIISNILRFRVYCFIFIKFLMQELFFPIYVQIGFQNLLLWTEILSGVFFLLEITPVLLITVKLHLNSAFSWFILPAVANSSSLRCITCLLCKQGALQILSRAFRSFSKCSSNYIWFLEEFIVESNWMNS